jgi:hypothetical protein
MKKISFLTGTLSLALMTMMLNSCEEDKPLDEAIIGKWSVQTEQQIYSLQNVKKFESTYYYQADEIAFEFTSGGSMIFYQDGDVYGMTTFRINGSTLIIETGDSDMEWEGVSINDNTMTWKETGTDVIDEETYNVEIIYTAVKD